MYSLLYFKHMWYYMKSFIYAKPYVSHELYILLSIFYFHISKSNDIHQFGISEKLFLLETWCLNESRNVSCFPIFDAYPMYHSAKLYKNEGIDRKNNRRFMHVRARASDTLGPSVYSGRARILLCGVRWSMWVFENNLFCIYFL